MNMRRSRAFTLIELLIVVAIIAILAAIAVPNFQRAQVKAKVARVEAEFKTVATGLALYQADWRKFPFGLTDLVPLDLVALTTPVAYLTTVDLKDVFMPKRLLRSGGENGNSPRGYLYFNLKGDWAIGRGVPIPARTETYILESQGPDRTQDYIPQFATGLEGFGPEQVYDSSNGIISLGDLARMGGQLPHNPLAHPLIH
ncbi:MAG TPA: prepilin-type N-terminal cleavage/methylation domain-containing protein [bacterium]|nr:prepilin-type N-terminal cleavage/methylation domain-containing protein [bacterium]HQL62211.1 prepilin-type N-terminal cleavage/methylation domain-containing protein [bacterium]